MLFLRSECVSENGLDLSQSMFISEQAHNVLRRSQVQTGDILVTITGNVGRFVFLDDVFGFGNINQHIARIRIVGENIDAKYIYFYLTQHSVREYYNSITTGQAYPQLSLTQVRNTLIPVPSLHEQKVLGELFSDMDSEIYKLQSQLNKTKSLKQGMMQELLTGRTRLIEPQAVTYVEEERLHGT